MSALRAALGIPPEVYKDFAQLRRKVLQVAKTEIDQLAHFCVEWREFRQGRTVAELEFRFFPKDAPAQLATVDELARHSAGRVARRENRVELLVPDERAPSSTGTAREVVTPQARSSSGSRARGALPPFPSGSLRFATDQEFRDIALTHGGGWDVDLIAEAYREQMGARLERLSGQKLRASWTGFCQSYLARRGRP